MSIETSATDSQTVETIQRSSVTMQLLGKCATPPPDHIKLLGQAIDEAKIAGRLDDRGINDVLNVFEGMPVAGDTAYATVIAAMIHQRALPIIKHQIRV